VGERILPGDHTCTRWATHRATRNSLIEVHALAREPIDRRRVRVGIAGIA
jgi:hypothetical protein